MVHRFRSSFALFIVLVLLLILVAKPAVQALNRYAETNALSVMLIIDISGSMERNDPQNLRETASRVFIDLLGPEDFLGILAFDHEIKELVPLQQVADNKSKFKAALAGGLIPRGLTDYVGALSAALSQFNSVDTGNARRVVVFLTDGEPNPISEARSNPAFMAKYLGTMWQLIDDYAAAGIPVYPVAFSEETDPDILERIAGDTGANFTFLPDPTNLVVTFFHLLSELKHRNLFVSETNEGGKMFEFNVTENTRQINIVALADAEDALIIRLTAPNGVIVTPENYSELTVSRHENSLLAVLNQPGENYQGTWSAVFEGSHVLSVMADTEQFISIRVLEPVHGGQHPLYEPLPITVEVIKIGDVDEGELEVEAVIKRPGRDFPKTVALQETDGLFHGEFTATEAAGTYEVLVRLLSQGQVITTAAADVEIQLLPTVSTDFWISDDYRVGAEIIVTGTLSLAGNRIAEGRELSVEYLRLDIEFADGVKKSLSLADSGEYQEHGDVREGDGIWSNRLIFTHAGQADATLRSAGTYKGTEFELERRLGTFLSLPQGKVGVAVESDSFWVAPEGTFIIPVTFISESSFREMIELSLGEEMVFLNNSSLTLDPGETKKVDLVAAPATNLTFGTYGFTLLAESENGQAVIEMQNADLTLEVITSRDALQRSFLGGILALGTVFMVLFILFILVFLIGRILYRIIVNPQVSLRGTLIYRGETTDSLTELNFTRLGKSRVTVSFDASNKSADFVVEQGEDEFTITIFTKWDNNLPKFLQGWRSLFRREIPVRIMLECEKPGVIEFEGEIYTGKELFHQDRFEASSISFQYINPYGRWHKSSEDGVDILKGKL